MFERDPVLPTVFSEQPRQCVPVAVIMYNRVGSITDAVDLRLVANDHPRCGRAKSPVSADRGVSVVLGQAGRRRVMVSRSEAELSGSVDTSEHQQTSQRTVSFCPSGTITKITINNDREKSDTASTTENQSDLSASHVASTAAASSSSSQLDAKTAVQLSTTETAVVPATNTRSQYGHLIRRRKKTQTVAVSQRGLTQSVSRAVLPSPPLPKPDDTPLTLLQYQKTLVSDVARQLSVELSAVTSFLRVTKPAHIDDRERVALQSMQRINAAFQRLTPVCLSYRRFCKNISDDTALPDVDVLRTHDSTLRRCRDKLTASFAERRDVILQTPIAGEQRLFTFVWLQRHSAAIIDCIKVVVDVLEAVLPPSTGSVQTSSGDVKPNVSELNVERVPPSGTRLDSDELTDEARPPSLIPAIKTDIVASADEPPVLLPCVDARHDETSNNARSLCQQNANAAAERRHSQDVRRRSSTERVDSSTPEDRPVVSLVALKQEQPEDTSTVPSCSTSLETVAADVSETLDRSQVEDHCARCDIIADTLGQIRV